MLILSGCNSCIHSFITNRVGRIFNSDCKVGGIETILLVRNEFIQFVWDLSKWICVFEANWSEGVDRFVKIQFARADGFVAEAVDIVFAVRLVVFTCGDLHNYRFSDRAAICVDNLEIYVTIASLRYFACFSKMTIKDRSTSSNRKFLIENLMN